MVSMSVLYDAEISTKTLNIRMSHEGKYVSIVECKNVYISECHTKVKYVSIAGCRNVDFGISYGGNYM